MYTLIRRDGKGKESLGYEKIEVYNVALSVRDGALRCLAEAVFTWRGRGRVEYGHQEWHDIAEDIANGWLVLEEKAGDK